MSVTIVPAAITPVVWDTTFDYNEAEKRLYARDDIDHKVYISHQFVWFNPDTGEIETAKERPK
jgi:hypothetical protein